MNRLSILPLNTIIKTSVHYALACLQCDEIRSFVGAKRKNASPEKEAEGWGDVWTWAAEENQPRQNSCWTVLAGWRYVPQPAACILIETRRRRMQVRAKIVPGDFHPAGS